MKTTRSPTPATGSRLAALRENRWFTLVWIIPLAILVLAGVVLAARGIRSLPDVQAFLGEYPARPRCGVGARRLSGLAELAARPERVLHSVCDPFRVADSHHEASDDVLEAQQHRTAPYAQAVDSHEPQCVAAHHVRHPVGRERCAVLYPSVRDRAVAAPRSRHVGHLPECALRHAAIRLTGLAVESGWVNYNAVQTISYFLVVFVAAPLALATGLRMSPAWTSRRLSRVFPIGLARAVHFPVMIFFVAFIVVHVILVFATGALRNLNHMYAARNDDGWLGFWIFAGALVLMILAWFAARPVVLRAIASLTGTVSR